MSLFIDSLAKRIIEHMMYRDDQINNLTTKNEMLNRGAQICGIDHDDDCMLTCEVCS